MDDLLDPAASPSIKCSKSGMYSPLDFMHFRLLCFREC